MDASTPETDSDETPRRSTLSVTRSRALAEACAQLTHTRNPQSLFSALDRALAALYGPNRYALWRAIAPDGLERVDCASSDADGTSPGQDVTRRRLSLSAWESVFTRNDGALFVDFPMSRGPCDCCDRTSPLARPDGLGIALRDLDDLAGAIAIRVPAAAPEREEDAAIGRVLAECASAVLSCISSLQRNRESLARLESAEWEREQKRQELARAEEQKRQFYRDILSAVTNGKLTLCDREEIDQYWTWPCVTQPVRCASDVRHVRDAVCEAGCAAGLSHDRLQDLCLCASEAATNALKHAGSGEAHVTVTRTAIRVRVEDWGDGIDAFHLPRATLMKGYSTQASMGLGFTLMHELADHLYLTTSAAGTTVIVEMALNPVSDLEQILARLSLSD